MLSMMVGKMKTTNHALVFVYNADSGLFNTVTGMAHKIFSPGTYECNLCALTYSTFGMREGRRTETSVFHLRRTIACGF